MAYSTYTTEALVCGSRPNHTSDKAFLLFTKDAGMLWATARSVREERSSQRYALQDFSLIKVSLVRGKSGWRIGSAESEYNAFTEAKSREARGMLTGMVRLLRQFMKGEESVPAVFEDSRKFLDSVKNEQNEKGHVVDVFAIRLLHKLGYISVAEDYEEYLRSDDWHRLGTMPESAYLAIENAKTVSHL